MTIAHPRRLRAERALPQALREALRELPNCPPEPAQLGELRGKLGLPAKALPAPVRPVLVPERRLRERRLRQTVVALLFFPIAATAAVGKVIELQRQSALRSATTSHSAVVPALGFAQQSSIQPSAPLRGPATVASQGLGAPSPANSAVDLARFPRAAARSELNAAELESARTLDVEQAAASEIELLQRANTALKADPAQALTLAAQHRQLFPVGNLAQEREVIAIKALLAVGDSAQARESLTRFERAYPRSAHVLELRRIVR
jgi:hypothetical protein